MAFSRWVAAAALCGVIAGCTSVEVDKSGASVTLAFTVGYAEAGTSGSGQSSAGPVFMAELRKHFGDRLDLVERGDVGKSQPGGDATLAKAIARGDIDAGWIATRALSEAGFRGFDALTAPMVITSYAAEKAIATGGEAEAMLGALEGSGLTGLAVTVGGLRRPVSSTEPLLEPADWKGRDVGVLAASQRPGVVDLEANPTTVESSMLNGFGGDFTAADLDIGSYENDQVFAVAPYVTANIVLWPKMWVFAVNTERFESLTAEEQGWVRAAAEAARTASTTDLWDDSAVALRQCDSGARFPSASPGQVRALRAAFEPTLRRLASDPVDGPILAQIVTTVSSYPEVDALAVPARCSAGAPEPRSVGAIPTTRSTIPPGIYRVVVTEKDLLDGGLPADRAADNDGVITLSLEADGTYRQTIDDLDPVSPEFTGMVWEVGTFTGTGSRVYFLPDLARLRALGVEGVEVAADRSGYFLQTVPYAVRWSLNGKDLALTDVVGLEDPVNVFWVTANPYRRIA